MENNLPHNKEIEQDVLGSIFLEPKLMNECIDTIKSSDFHDEVNKRIFTAMSYIHHNNQQIDYSSVIDRLKYKKLDVDIDYIMSLPDCVATTNNFDIKVERLLDVSQKRELYKLGEFLTQKDIVGVSNDNLLKRIQDTIDSTRVVSNIELTNTKDYSKEWLEDFKKPISNNKLVFGFKKLDEIVGIETTGMTLIAGGTGSGKSALALEISKNFAMQNKKVLFVTLEMSKKQVINRLVANIAEVEHDKIKNKLSLSKDEEIRINKALETISKLNINIFDGGNMNIDHLHNLMKKLKKKNQLDVAIIDYIGLLQASAATEGSNYQRMSYMSRKLKMIAQDLYVPMIVLAQLNRNHFDAKSGKNREPSLSDLKDSSSLEQDSNHVIMLYNKSNDKSKSNDDPEDLKKSFIDIFVRKNREGTTGRIVTTFYGDYLHFEEQEWDSNENKYKPITQKTFNEEVNYNDFIKDDDLPF